jgi:hypothetical protein
MVTLAPPDGFLSGTSRLHLSIPLRGPGPRTACRRRAVGHSSPRAPQIYRHATKQLDKLIALIAAALGKHFTATKGGSE